MVHKYIPDPCHEWHSKVHMQRLSTFPAGSSVSSQGALVADERAHHHPVSQPLTVFQQTLQSALGEC